MYMYVYGCMYVCIDGAKKLRAVDDEVQIQ